MATRRFGPYAVETSNEDKVLFPADGITKGELIEHYARLADVMLPHLADRPLVMHRFPDGIEAGGFYHKDAPEHFPDWIRTESMRKEGGRVRHVVVDNAATLVHVANQGCITPHVWLSRVDEPERPDRIVIDLDPPGDDFEPVRTAARRVADRLEDLGLVVALQVTGSSGVHVVCPIRREGDFDEARRLVRAVAGELAEAHPESLTVEQRTAARGDRVFLDCGRNARAQTMVAPYAVRARPGAPVATPIAREELDDPALHARRWTIRTIHRRLGQRADPWRGLGRHARSIRGIGERARGGDD